MASVKNVLPKHTGYEHSSNFELFRLWWTIDEEMFGEEQWFAEQELIKRGFKDAFSREPK